MKLMQGLDTSLEVDTNLVVVSKAVLNTNQAFQINLVLMVTESPTTPRGENLTQQN